MKIKTLFSKWYIKYPLLIIGSTVSLSLSLLVLIWILGIWVIGGFINHTYVINWPLLTIHVFMFISSSVIFIYLMSFYGKNKKGLVNE